MAEDGSVPGSGIDDGVDDDILDHLHRCDPVDPDVLPSSRSAKAMRMLEQILESEQEPESGRRELGGRD